VFTQLDEKFSEAENNSAVKAIAFQGAGKAFVAGADIRYFVNNIKNDKIADTVQFTREGHELFLRIENCAKLTIAVLDGLSLGGGSELALACQAIVATPAGSMGFPETGIGIYPGLGGMLRLALQVGLDLAKYYVLTGKPISAKAASELGIVTKLVGPAEMELTINELISRGKPDKYRQRDIPGHFNQFSAICSAKNIESVLARQAPKGIDNELAAKTAKTLVSKAPLALKVTNEIMDQQQGKSMSEAIEIELGRLMEIFSTEDALLGLSSMGRKASEYKGV
ncbi:enoyl-CoA hydratase/isomerase family protein, partial [bacterium]|nr:enoyl-CoA hydratase/isomerase family protein [bacterium]